MMRPSPWPLPVAIALWIAAEILRHALLPAATVQLGAGLVALAAGPRAWPVYQAWGLACTPIVDTARRQQQADGCGAAALQAVLLAHGRHVRQSLLWSLTRLPGGGTSAARLARVGNCFGLDCTVRRLVIEARTAVPAASSCPLPAVVHLRRGHFVVLRRWSAAGAWLFDPAHGGVRVGRAVLCRQASGFVITCVDRGDAAARRGALARRTATAGGAP